VAGRGAKGKWNSLLWRNALGYGTAMFSCCTTIMRRLCAQPTRLDRERGRLITCMGTQTKKSDRIGFAIARMVAMLVRRRVFFVGSVVIRVSAMNAEIFSGFPRYTHRGKEPLTHNDGSYETLGSLQTLDSNCSPTQSCPYNWSYLPWFPRLLGLAEVTCLK